LEPSVYFVDHPPVSVVPLTVVVIMVASFAVSALATMTV
jgi:hypothetical protein